MHRLETALEITGAFETGKAPGASWGAIAGDFDGMGLSAGVLQWNIGMGTLQPLVRAVGPEAVRDAMPRHGTAFWRACTAPVPPGLAILRQWQDGGRFRPAVLAELRALMTSPGMVAQQKAAALKIARKAQHLAEDWALARGMATCTTREFCWFFDLVVQNGGLKGLGIGDVRQFASRCDGAEPVAAICGWLAAQPGDRAGSKDGRRNAALWKESGRAADGSADDLFVLSYLRACKSRAAYAGIVMNRKGAIAFGEGWVNGTRHDFRARF